jgi:SNF2 family DNA or RNA helicase
VCGCVFLPNLSTGINLTAADVCILHDLDFNPFNDLQAEDRCHRIGQTKPVRVIKMVTTETVDDDIYSMQQRKTSMNAAILEKGGSSLDSAAEKKKDQEEIKSMLQNQLDRYLSSETTKSNSGGMIQFLKKK